MNESISITYSFFYQNRMFRRLAAVFDAQEPFQGADTSHTEYITQQNKYFQTMPNLIPSATSGLKGFGDAIKTVDTNGQSHQDTAIPYPDDIFRSDRSPELVRMADQCSKGSIDELIAAKNPQLSTGCGWLYTPPLKDSPYPQLSKGFIGNEQGPLNAFAPPEYKKWFFDLQLAKKQALLDRCKALKACSDVDSEAFKGMCGYCTDSNQGVPIDTVGRPLYANDPVGGCSASAVIRSADRCPPPPPVAAGPQPIVDRTCDPVNGRLSAVCLNRQVLSAGCSDKGSLSVALSGSPDPNDYMSNLRNADSVKVYNRVANPPLNIDMFRQGRATVQQVLQEVRQLAAHQAQPENSALGAAARDLCTRSGALSAYDMCSDLPDDTPAPFDMACLQKIFLKMGGQPKGTAYPNAETMTAYNQLGSLGAVKQYIQRIIAAMNSGDYDTQRGGMIQFLGIVPEKAMRRAPYQQGVEVFWFIPEPGNPRRVLTFLKRTIERDIVSLKAGPSRVPQISGQVGSYAAMLQLMDVRAPSDFSVKYRITIDDGFWITNNQPADIDRTAMDGQSRDAPGFFENLGLQGPTLYQSQTCTEYKSATPNITKLFFEDAGGGWNANEFSVATCSGTSAFQGPNYSLTCELRAPFLTYEVNTKAGSFEELRNPGLFGQFLGLRGLEFHLRKEERATTPGKKGFVRINNANALIDMPNIAFQSWKTMSTCVRLQSMPVKDTLLKFAMKGYYFSVVLTPMSGSVAQVSIEHNFSGQPKAQSTTFRMNVNKWYMVGVHNWGTGMTLFINGVDEMVANKGYADGVRIDTSGEKLFSVNGSWNNIPGQTTYEQCTIMMGTNGFANRGDWPSHYGSGTFQYDLAWIHFFQQMCNGDDMARDAAANWIYTQFPVGYNQFKLTED